MGVNNQELDINIDTYPITLNYNSNDLNENKTGFLPVNISVSNPNFVQLYADKYWPNTNPEVPDDQPTNHIFNQPIQFNGKYKFIPFESPPGSFPVAGYIPQYMNDQNATNWDLNINIPQTLVNNYTQPTITTNGTYTIPSGYTGFNNFNVSVPNSNIILKGFKYGSSSTTIIEFKNFPTTTGNFSLENGKSVLMLQEVSSNKYRVTLRSNNTGSTQSITPYSPSVIYHYSIINGISSNVFIVDNNDIVLFEIFDQSYSDASSLTFYIYTNRFTIIWN